MKILNLAKFIQQYLKEKLIKVEIHFVIVEYYFSLLFFYYGKLQQFIFKVTVLIWNWTLFRADVMSIVNKFNVNK